MRARTRQLELPLQYRQRQAIGRAHVTLDGRLVTYTIKRSAKRSAISIAVDEDGLRVGAPWHATQPAVERLLRKHAAWVLRKLGEWALKRAPPRRWADGEPLMLYGEPLRLRLSSSAERLDTAGGDVVVPAKESTAPVSRQVVQWLHEQALRCFAERVEHYRRALAIPDAPDVQLSSARTRWGSCHASGRIHLNWRLVQMPLRLIDYVVAHEVAHLVEMNHSQRFWRVVGRLIPDYHARRTEIRRDGHRYLLV